MFLIARLGGSFGINLKNVGSSVTMPIVDTIYRSTEFEESQERAALSVV
jgi:hypothetical protein